MTVAQDAQVAWEFAQDYFPEEVPARITVPDAYGGTRIRVRVAVPETDPDKIRLGITGYYAESPWLNPEPGDYFDRRTGEYVSADGTRTPIWEWACARWNPSLPAEITMNLDDMTPAQRAIYDAMQAVEAEGASESLTDAVRYLTRAQDAMRAHYDDPDTVLARGVREVLVNAVDYTVNESHGRIMALIKARDEAVAAKRIPDMPF